MNVRYVIVQWFNNMSRAACVPTIDCIKLCLCEWVHIWAMLHLLLLLRSYCCHSFSARCCFFFSFSVHGQCIYSSWRDIMNKIINELLLHSQMYAIRFVTSIFQAIFEPTLLGCASCCGNIFILCMLAGIVFAVAVTFFSCSISRSVGHFSHSLPPPFPPSSSHPSYTPCTLECSVHARTQF